MKYVLYAFLLYILYVFVFKLVIPVYMASRRFKKGFREMQNKMNEQFQQQQQQYNSASAGTKPVTPKAPAGDYIDFEEVK